MKFPGGSAAHESMTGSGLRNADNSLNSHDPIEYDELTSISAKDRFGL